MRLVDLVVRQGHLSERALAEAVIAGVRPVHVDRCDLCAARAVDMGRWLDQMRDAAVIAADQAFPAERLAAQHAQILRRLAQLDEPARVIAFPSHYRLAQQTSGTRRVAAAWVGVAAAAGLFIGAVGGHFSAKVDTRQAAVPAASVPATSAPAATTQPAADPDPATTTNASLLDLDLDNFTPTAIQALDTVTPTLVNRSTR